jgi:2'-5' RNA ligase
MSDPGSPPPVGTSSRLFVSIEPSAEAIQSLRVSSRVWRPALEVPGIRWLPPAQWHVTLLFLGDVDDARVPELGQALSRATACSGPFELALGTLGAFPSPGRPRVIWIGLQGDLQALHRVQAAVACDAAPWIHRPDPKPFHPHLTLARVSGPSRPGAWRQAAGAGGGMTTAPRTVGWPVRSVRLMKSELTPTGARHELVCEILLRGSTSPGP